MNEWRTSIPIIKADQAQGLVTGWVSVVATPDGTPIIDSDDDVIPAEELEIAVQKAMVARGTGAGAVGDMHVPELSGAGDLVETMVFTPEKYDALGIPRGPMGWVATFKVDPKSQLFADIASGKRAELSLEGSAATAEEVWIDAAA